MSSNRNRRYYAISSDQATTSEYVPDEWLLSSYIATGMENIPIFIIADHAENERVMHDDSCATHKELCQTRVNELYQKYYSLTRLPISEAGTYNADYCPIFALTSKSMTVV